MLELLATADPLSALLGCLWLFAAGMFPVGFMLGAQCNPCCGCSPKECPNGNECNEPCVCHNGECVRDPCTICTDGNLPDTLTVTFSGFQDQAPGPDLITLAFSSCYGIGATASVTAPGGDPATDKGPISAVTLTNGGGGYAQLGRVAPTLTVSGGSGTGATFTPTLQSSQDSCKFDFWSLKSVSVSGGTGYVNGESLTVSVAVGDTESASAAATVTTKRDEPTLTYTGSADLSISVTPSGANWAISSVAVNDGGTGYLDDEYIGVTLGTGDTVVSSALLQASTGRIEPTVTPYVVYGSGSSATFTTTLTKITYAGKDAWETTAVNITAAGSGYTVGDTLYATTNGQRVNNDFVGTVASVNGSGGITAVNITQAGQYILSDGIIQSVAVIAGGLYYKDTGEPSSVTVTGGGSFYREDPDEPPYVATVTVTVTDTPPSAGSDAELSVTIDDDTDSETFGEITGITIDDGGDGYLAHELFDTCLSRFDGRSIVVKRGVGGEFGQCGYLFTCAQSNCHLEEERVYVFYDGPDSPMRIELGITLYDGVPGFNDYGIMIADENSPDCNDIDVTATGVSGVPEGATAHIVAGGEYEETETCQKITREDLESLYIEVSWGEISDNKVVGSYGCGTDSSISSYALNKDTTGGWCNTWKGTVETRIAQWAALGQNIGEAYAITSNCSQVEGASSLGGGIQPSLFCTWKWDAGNLCVTISRGAQLSWLYDGYYGPVTNNVTGGRLCEWCYPVIRIPTDEDYIPSGAVEFGEPTYSTSVSGNAPAVALWFDDLFSEENVCIDPGTPTVTFSRLP